MPTSARKSSVPLSRRDSIKNHVPYRGDDPAIGKKTGISVRPVQRKSDGFERFDEVMSQADTRTPPQVKGRKKKRVDISPIDEFAEYDDDDDDLNRTVDMELDSPVKPTNAFSGNNSVTRVGGPSRPVRPSSGVDFDEVPSPSVGRSRHKSLTNLSNYAPSRLSKASTDYGSPTHSDFDYDGSLHVADDHDHHLDNSFANTTQTSLVALDQCDDEEIEDANQSMNAQSNGSAVAGGDVEEEELPPTTAKRGKGEGKEKAPVDESPDPWLEDDANGLDYVGMQPDDEPPEEPSSKRAKVNGSKPKGKAIVRMAETIHSPTGARRSQRHRYAPLEWWRLEKVVYGKRETGETLVPQIKEIIRIPKEFPQPLGKRKRGGAQRSKSKTRASTEVEEQMPIMINPEEGWDDATSQLAEVLDYRTQQVVERRIAFTTKMVNPRQAANADWLFQKVFGDADFIAAGQLVIPPGARKPSKGTKDNTYIFYVIEGAVNLKVHESSLVLATGGMFMVPRGNTYYIENVAEREAKLFFTQARKIGNDDDDETTSSAIDRRSSEPRSAIVTARPLSAAPLSQVNGRATSETRPVKRAASTKT